MALHEAGCEDATVSLQKGVVILDFTRWARSLLHAILSAVGNVESASARVVRVEPYDWAGVTRAAVSLYANGERGRDFPGPVHRVTTDSPPWDWVEVARWLHRQGRLTAETLLSARVFRFANSRIEMRGRNVHRPEPRETLCVSLGAAIQGPRTEAPDCVVEVVSHKSGWAGRLSALTEETASQTPLRPP